MPLSEQEQRLLEEMERSLYHNDADYVAGASGTRGKPTYAMIVTGVLIGVVGVGTLISGVAIHVPVVGVVGFALMFVGVLVALTPPRGGRPRVDRAADATGKSDTRTSGPATDGTYRQNPGERYDNRSDDREE